MEMELLITLSSSLLQCININLKEKKTYTRHSYTSIKIVAGKWQNQSKSHSR